MIQVGDVLVSIDGTSTHGMKKPEATGCLRGKAGTMVRLVLRRQVRVSRGCSWCFQQDSTCPCAARLAMCGRAEHDHVESQVLSAVEHERACACLGRDVLAWSGQRVAASSQPVLTRVERGSASRGDKWRRWSSATRRSIVCGRSSARSVRAFHLA
eukprot:651091-Rhodomonas_salina.2